MLHQSLEVLIFERRIILSIGSPNMHIKILVLKNSVSTNTASDAVADDTLYSHFNSACHCIDTERRNPVLITLAHFRNQYSYWALS